MSKKLVEAMNSGVEACSDCAFSDMHEQNDALFYCRKRAPAHIKGDRGVWPVVGEDDWCGEYRKAKDA
jgi:hypothetical protein